MIIEWMPQHVLLFVFLAKQRDIYYYFPIDTNERCSKAEPTMEATPGNEMSNKPTMTFH